MMHINQYKVDIPEGEKGRWKIERFTVSEEDERWGRLRAAISFSSAGRYVSAGTYTRLMRDRTVVMSDTHDEINDHIAPILESRGDCLINGLGLGVVVKGMLLNPKVEKVTVIEIEQDVIDLVAPHYLKQFGERLEVICADALEWKAPKGKRYSVVWHDIWDHISPENLPDMHKLHRKYGRRSDWQGSWARWRCERYR